MRKLILALLVVVSIVSGCKKPASTSGAPAAAPGTPPAAQAAPAAAPGSPQAATPAAAPATAPAGTPATAQAGTPAPGAPAAVTAAPAGSAMAPAASAQPVAPAAGAQAAAAAAPAPAAPQWREVVVPADTVLSVILENSVSSDQSQLEDPVSASLVADVVLSGTTALPAGSLVGGTVTHAKRAGKTKGVAELSIRFDSLSPKGSDAHYEVRTAQVARRAQTTRNKDAATIGVPAAGGAILGGIVGGKKGAVIGGVVGGGAGTAVVLTSRGKELRLPRGTRLSLKLLEPVTVRVPVQ